MSDRPEKQRYMPGNTIRAEIILEHEMNLNEVYIGFSHQEDPLTTISLDGEPRLGDEAQPGGLKQTRVMAEGIVPPRARPGLYRLERIGIVTSEHRVTRLVGEGQLPEVSFEVIEEPKGVPKVSQLRLL